MPTTPPTNATPPVTETKPSTQPSPTQAPSGGAGSEAVKFTTTDGAVTINAHLYSVAGPMRRVVILASVIPEQESSWQSYAQSIVAPGVSVLTVAMPGYGGGSRDIAQLDKDLEVAVLFMKSRGYAQIYLVGERAGGTAALKVAARQELAGVATISSSVSVLNVLDSSKDIAAITEPKLFVAAKDDYVSATAVSTVFMPLAVGTKQSLLIDGSAQGPALVLNAPAADKLTFTDFLTK